MFNKLTWCKVTAIFVVCVSTEVCSIQQCQDGTTVGMVSLASMKGGRDIQHTDRSYLMTNKAYMSPCCGLVKKWSVALATGTSGLSRPITFQVWRRGEGNSTYKLVGESQFSIGGDSRRNRFQRRRGYDRPWQQGYDTRRRYSRTIPGHSSSYTRRGFDERRQRSHRPVSRIDTLGSRRRYRRSNNPNANNQRPYRSPTMSNRDLREEPSANNPGLHSSQRTNSRTVRTEPSANNQGSLGSQRTNSRTVRTEPNANNQRSHGSRTQYAGAVRSNPHSNNERSYRSQTTYDRAVRSNPHSNNERSYRSQTTYDRAVRSNPYARNRDSLGVQTTNSRGVGGNSYANNPGSHGSRTQYGRSVSNNPYANKRSQYGSQTQYVRGVRSDPTASYTEGVGDNRDHDNTGNDYAEDYVEDYVEETMTDYDTDVGFGNDEDYVWRRNYRSDDEDEDEEDDYEDENEDEFENEWEGDEEEDDEGDEDGERRFGVVSFTLPDDQRILMRPGDVIGWHTPRGDVVSYTPRYYNLDNIVVSRKGRAEVGDTNHFPPPLTSHRTYAIHAELTSGNPPLITNLPASVTVPDDVSQDTVIFNVTSYDADEGDVNVFFIPNDDDDVEAVFAIDHRSGAVRAQKRLDDVEYDVTIIVLDSCGSYDIGTLKIVTAERQANHDDNPLENDVFDVSDDVNDDGVSYNDADSTHAVQDDEAREEEDHASLTDPQHKQREGPDSRTEQQQLEQRETSQSHVVRPELTTDKPGSRQGDVTAQGEQPSRETNERTSRTQSQQEKNDGQPTSDYYVITVNEDELEHPIALPASILDQNLRLYHLTGGSGKNDFRVDPASGNLFFTGTYDFDDPDVSSTLTLDISARKRPRGKWTGTLEVKVKDVNDNAPEVTSHLLTLIVSNGVRAGEAIGQIHARDRDRGENARLKFQLISSSVDEGIFGVRADGSIVVRQSLDTVADREARLGVLVSDHGNPPLSTTVGVFVIMQ